MFEVAALWPPGSLVPKFPRIRMEAIEPAIGPRLLLIEDDRIFGRATVRALSTHGFAVTWACSCSEARAVVGARGGLRLDYAVVDDRLGDGFGLELLPLLDALRPRPLAVLISAHLSAQRAIAALRAERVVLPKPATPSELLELLALLDERAPLQDAVSKAARGHVFGVFELDAQGLHTPTGFVALRRASLAMLRFLLSRSAGFSSAADIARDLFGRGDEAARALVRRQIANLRQSLGPHAWVVASVPKHGYRIDPGARDPRAVHASVTHLREHPGTYDAENAGLPRLHIRRSVLGWGPFRVDLLTDQVWVNGQELPNLQRSAVRFLAHLLENAGRVCTHEEISRTLFNGRSLNERHSARIVSALRQRSGAAGRLIVTQRGIGYGLGVGGASDALQECS